MHPSKLYKIEDSKKFFLLLLKKYKIYYKFKKFIIEHRRYITTPQMTFTSILINHLTNDESPKCLFNALDEAKYVTAVDLGDILFSSTNCETYLLSCILRHIDKYKEYHNY